MAEAPNILTFLLLTSAVDSLPSFLAMFETCIMTIWMLWICQKYWSFSTHASKTDKSTRKSRRHQYSCMTTLRYHCFKQRMKFKKAHKGKYSIPPPLFYLTWKFTVLKLTFILAAVIYKVGIVAWSASLAAFSIDCCMVFISATAPI